MSSRKYIWTSAALGVLAMAFAARGELDKWVENIDAGSKLDRVFFRTFALSTGPVTARRAPKETRAELSKLIDQTPTAADLYSLRALEDEKQLDFTAAEADWKKQVELAANKVDANLSLADYYHRRLAPKEEIDALRAVTAAQPAPADGQLDLRRQKAWTAFERILGLIDDQALDAALAAEQYQAWVARYPKDSESYRRACLALIQKKQFPAVEQILAAYERQFPQPGDFPIQVRAGLELAKGSPDRALAFYEQSFKPVWSDDLANSYFTLLNEEGRLKKYGEQLGAQIAANPTDLNAAARLYYYMRRQNNSNGATDALAAFRKHKEQSRAAWSPQEHETLAILFEKVNRYDDAARHYHALYVQPGASAAQTEMALSDLATLLLTAPEQPIQIGAGDLSFYRDIATMDRSPGYLNGVLSLILNSQSPPASYENQNAQAQAYFHRVKASQLATLFEQKYPRSERRAGLRAKLVQVYATYGDSKAVLENGHRFLTQFPNAAERTEIALIVADGHARADQAEEEFAIYRMLLVELAKKAGGKPVGTVAPETAQARDRESGDDQADPNQSQPVERTNENRGLRMVTQAGKPVADPSGGVRSQDYVRVLDRYLARLVSMNRMPDALRVYRGELTRNPDDPGLYERFATFLDQNKLGADIERVYRDAMQRFPDDKDWTQKLARWYLRNRQQARYADLTKQVTQIFSGTDLEAYLRNNPSAGPLSVQVALQVNQYAHQRFPHNLSFVRNLLNVYTARATANPAAYEQLLRDNWFHASDLRSRFFELLSRTRRLDTELAALRALKTDAEANPAAARLLAEAEVWKTNYESAAQPFRLLAAAFPAESDLDDRAASLQRSLGRVDAAIQIESNLSKAEPRNREILARLGEIQGDRERYDLASPYWLKMASLEPGRPDGYLDSATVFWDYFQFADAIKMIQQARTKLGNPALFAYEAGAVRENQRDYPAALNEYAKGALAEGTGGRCRDRLLRLAKRPSLKTEADAVTRRLGESQVQANISLRISFLEDQSRRADLEQYLTATLGNATTPEVLGSIDVSARSNEIPQVSRGVLERRIALTSDPIDKLRARIDLAGFHERQNDIPRATELMESLLRENPMTLGMIRSTVNYYWRTGQQPKAVDLLVTSSNKAQQPYQDRFRFEAAQKAIDIGAYDRGQELLSGLLAKEPYRADYLAANGDLYARRGDDAGLKGYYLATIESLRKSPLSPEERVQRVAAMRRTLIPVLVRLKRNSEAIDQYIEIINRYPEDEGVVREAALFAIQNGQRQRLTDYYAKTAAAASRDHRWPIVVSQIETQAENFPAALEWLAKARIIRPERTGLLAAKGPLEERLLKFDEASKTYAVLWELTYHDPQWMVKVAEQQQRLGRPTDAISALRRGFIEGRPARAENFTSAAQQCVRWGLLEPAKEFLDQGLQLQPANQTLLTLDTEVAAKRHLALRIPDAKTPEAVANSWGDTVAKYATSEEKSALAPKLTLAVHKSAATHAGFVELRASWESPVDRGVPNAAWLQLQKDRGRFEDIALQIEAAAKNPSLTVQQRDGLLAFARDYYAQTGNAGSELRLLEMQLAAGRWDNAFVGRYAAIVSRDLRRAETIVASSAASDLRDTIANKVFMHGPADAFAIVSALGRGFTPPVWGKAYTALTGIYYDVRTNEVKEAFRGVLGPRTIGEQLGRTPDEKEQLVGGPWYYYAARFGEYLDKVKAGEAEDYLLSRLEATPDSAVAYEALADYYDSTGAYQRAAAEYDYVLQLDPSSGAPHAKKAAILARQGNQQAAIEEWKLAFAGFERGLNGRAPAGWWEEVAALLRDLREYKAFPALRADATRVLQLNFKRNTYYNAETLAEAIFDAPGDSKTGAEWYCELARASIDPIPVLAFPLNGKWLPDQSRDIIHARTIEVLEARANSAMGPERENLREAVTNARIARIRDLMEHSGADLAARLFAELPKTAVENRPGELAAIEVRIFAKRKTLVELFTRYDAAPDRAPDIATLVGLAKDLRQEGDAPSATTILAYVYGRELGRRNFTAPVFLGLAEVKLAQNDLPAALELLRRMNLIVGQPFELLDDSARLLWQTGHTKEAREYYELLMKVQPWEINHRFHLAQLRLENSDRSGLAEEFGAIAKDGRLPYASRVTAADHARQAGGIDGLNSGSGELDLLAGEAAITEQQARQPFYVAARLAAANMAKDPASRFRTRSEALAIAPADPARPRYQLFLSAVETQRYPLANLLQADNNFDSGLTTQEQVHLYKSLAEVKRQTGDPAAAIRFQRTLSQLLTGPERATLDREIARAEDQIALARANEARRPIISDALLPNHVVRPRLAALPGMSKGAQQQ